MLISKEDLVAVTHIVPCIMIPVTLIIIVYREREWIVVDVVVNLVARVGCACQDSCETLLIHM